MEVNNVQLITQLIGQLGFPIFVAVFMLFKQSKDTEKMTEILTKQQTTLEMLVKTLEKE